MRKWLPMRRAKGSFCSTSSTVRPFSLVEPHDDVADLAHDVRLDTFGGLVEDQHLGIDDQRAADGQLLLLAAGQVAAAATGHALEHGKELEDLSGMSRRPSARAASPVRRFSSTVSCEKISRPCGT